MSAENTQPDYLSMSDEDVMKMMAPATVDAVTETPEVAANAGAAEGGAGTENTNTNAADEDGEGEGSGEGADNAAGAADQASTEGGAAAEAGEGEGAGTQETKTPEAGDKPADKTTEQSTQAPAIDYKAEYEKFMAPFKANGREISVGSVEDAVALMQMGANYNKKMAALKPNLKLMKLLENNNLLSEERISFLIELEKKNPAAINKLVKDSGLNPLDFDAEKASEYKPTIHTVDDRELALDTILEEIQESPSYNRTLEVVSKEWDGDSKRVIAQNPQLLKVINDHITRGIYDTISNEVERERMLGRLNGVSDIEAYRRVGDAINARGGFNHLGSSQGNSTTQTTVVPPKPKKVDDAALNDKRRAAGSTKPANAAPAVAPEFNPLAMSDEEFAQIAAKRFR